jgi:RNA polymerase sigma factor (sigma-70 family)
MENPLHGKFDPLSKLKVQDRKVDRMAKYVGIADQIIWEDFRCGDESAFIHIYTTHFKDLISFGYQFCRDLQLIEDCVQDLFVDLRRKRIKLSPIKNSIRLYLFQALKRRITDYQKKLNKVNLSNCTENYIFEIIQPHEAQIIDEQVYHELIDKLNCAIKQLTVRQREALYYLYFKNMSYEEIRVLMGLDNIKSVRNLIYKAIAALKPLIETSIIVLIVFLKAIFS